MDFNTIMKAELHCHLDGSVSVELLEQLAKEQDPSFALSKEEVENLVSVDDQCPDLKTYLEKFDFILKHLQSQDALKRATVDVLSQGAKENVCYMELRFAPTFHLEKGLTIKKAIQAVLQGMKQAKQQLGIESSLIVCLMRHESKETHDKVIQAVKEIRRRHNVAMDLAGDEHAYPTIGFSEQIEKMYALKIPFTLHAGETGNEVNVMDSIVLGAKRIGHGLAMSSYDEIKRFARSQKVMVEMCPTSNLQTKAIASLKEYPIKEFMNDEILVSINTDNRTVSHTNLTREFEKLNEAFPVDVNMAMKITIDTIEAGFMDENTRARLLEKVQLAYQSLEQSA
ncbi:adenosine deaminase [Breznakia blatticola]|uniref:adenosine deaminase n=1 Tax=Breznakia blatticola TaxID=1754012 RepID=A0A4R8A5W8_9FIRM|nr:adenosine deaminase [Breznakia blatticola]TDW26002.1 adenosine deaminase [Breznakia blatticola]